jgi:methyl-accepting chemotaxis protein
MSKFKFRIGAKLGLSAGIGVLFVGVMLMSQMIGGSSVATSSGEAIAQRMLSQIATDVKDSSRGMMLAVRDLRLAQTAEDAERATAMAQARAESVTKHANEALKLIHLPENRERVEKIKSLTAGYIGVGRDIGAAKAEILATTVKRQQNGDAWRQQYAAANKVLEASKSPKAGEAERALRDAAALFDNARTAGWRYSATGETAQAARAAENTDKTLAQLQSLRTAADDKAFATAVDGLVPVVAEFKSLMSGYVQVSQQVAVLVRDKALPIAREMGELSDKVAAAAIHQAEEASAHAASTTATVERLDMGLGAFVVLVLVGSAVFGSLSIAKPIRKIAEVLLELGGGNKQVDVPYVGRGDEIGDAANAANIFKENLIRIQ